MSSSHYSKRSSSEFDIGSDDSVYDGSFSAGERAEGTTPESDDAACRARQLHFMEKVVLKVITNNRNAGPFLKPVDAVLLNLPDYHNVIKYPMDLSTIRKKLRSKAYSNASECVADFQLMFRNCHTFNGPEDLYNIPLERCELERSSMSWIPEVKEEETVTVMCRQLEEQFAKKIAHIPTGPKLAVNGKKRSSGSKPKSSVFGSLTPRPALSKPALLNPLPDAAVASRLRAPVVNHPADVVKQSVAVTLEPLNHSASTPAMSHRKGLRSPSVDVKSPVTTPEPADVGSAASRKTKGTKRKAEVLVPAAAAAAFHPTAAPVAAVSLGHIPQQSQHNPARRDSLRPAKRSKSDSLDMKVSSLDSGIVDDDAFAMRTTDELRGGVGEELPEEVGHGRVGFGAVLAERETGGSVRPGGGKVGRRKSGQSQAALKFCSSVLKEFYNKRGRMYASPFYDAASGFNGATSGARQQSLHLGTIKAKLDEGEYESVEQFAVDIRLMVANCVRLNAPGSEIVLKAKKLKSVFERKYARMPTSGDDAVAHAPYNSNGASVKQLQHDDQSNICDESGGGASSSYSSSSDDEEERERERQLQALTLQLKALQESVRMLTEEQTQSKMTASTSAVKKKTIKPKDKRPQPGTSRLPPAGSSLPAATVTSGFDSGGEPPHLSPVYGLSDPPAAASTAVFASPSKSAAAAKAPRSRQVKEPSAQKRSRGARAAHAGVKSSSTDDDVASGREVVARRGDVTSAAAAQAVVYQSEGVKPGDDALHAVNDGTELQHRARSDSDDTPEPVTSVSRPVLHSLPRQPMRPSNTAAPKPQQPIKSPVTVTPSFGSKNLDGPVKAEQALKPEPGESAFSRDAKISADKELGSPAVATHQDVFQDFLSIPSIVKDDPSPVKTTPKKKLSPPADILAAAASATADVRKKSDSPSVLSPPTAASNPAVTSSVRSSFPSATSATAVAMASSLPSSTVLPLSSVETGSLSSPSATLTSSHAPATSSRSVHPTMASLPPESPVKNSPEIGRTKSILRSLSPSRADEEHSASKFAAAASPDNTLPLRLVKNEDERRTSTESLHSKSSPVVASAHSTRLDVESSRLWNRKDVPQQNVESGRTQQQQPGSRHGSVEEPVAERMHAQQLPLVRPDMSPPGIDAHHRSVIQLAGTTDNHAKTRVGDPQASQSSKQKPTPQPALFQPAFMTSTRPPAAGGLAYSLQQQQNGQRQGGGLLAASQAKPQSPLLAGLKPAALQRQSSSLWMPSGGAELARGDSRSSTAGHPSSGQPAGSHSIGFQGAPPAVTKWGTGSIVGAGLGSSGILQRSSSRESSSPKLMTTVSPPLLMSSAENGGLPSLHSSQISSTSSAMGGVPVTPSDSNKKDTTIKNVNSWSKLASLSHTPGSSGSARKSSAMQCFEQFRRQAKEKEERERATREQEDQRKRDEQRRGRGEQEHMDRLRLEQQQQRRQQVMPPAAAPPRVDPVKQEERVHRPVERAPAPAPERAEGTKEAVAGSADEESRKALEKRKEIERLREQERRRREASAMQIDMNAQSELMASFEYDLK